MEQLADFDAGFNAMFDCQRVYNKIAAYRSSLITVAGLLCSTFAQFVCFTSAYGGIDNGTHCIEHMGVRYSL